MSLSKVKTLYRKVGHPMNFGGINKTARFHKISNDSSHRYLANAKSYPKFREYKKPRKRNCFFAYVRNEYLQLDLIELPQFARYNNGVKYLLNAIDVFSRYAYSWPTKNKTAKHIASIIEKNLLPLKPKVRNIYSDRGGEFFNRFLRKLCQDNQIHLYHATSDMKASICERFNRTLQGMIFKYLEEYDTKKYIDVLPDLVDSYNNSPHRTLGGLTPHQAMLDKNHVQVMRALEKHYSSFSNRKLKRFKIGDRVRIRKFHSPFVKGYEQSWSDEIFKIAEVKDNMPIVMYKIQSTANDGFERFQDEDPIEGAFYANELSLVTS